jgi:6-pyruvoyl-tetrahydropterin synthase
LSDEYTVQVDCEFIARHRLGPDGNEQPLHEHRWRVAVCAASQQLDRIAIVVDFRKLRQQTDDLMARLAGRTLEETEELVARGAAPLEVAHWFLDQLRDTNAGENYRITTVTVGCDPRIDFTVGEPAD